MSERSGWRTPPAERSALCILPGAANSSPTTQPTAGYSTYKHVSTSCVCRTDYNNYVELFLDEAVHSSWYKLVLRVVADLLYP